MYQIYCDACDLAHGFTMQAENTFLRCAGLLAGALAALRHYDGAGRNQVAGPDLGWQIGHGWRARLQWLQSETTAQPGPGGAALVEGVATRGHLAHAKLVYQGDDRREAELMLEDVGAGFRDDTGFIAQAGVRRAKGRAAIGWGPLGPFNEFWLNLEGERVTDRGTGALVLQDLAPGVWLTGAHNLEAWAYLHGLVRDTAAMRPVAGGALDLRQGDIAEAIAGLPTAGFGALLHDPPRFGIAGELYSQAFYDELARVLQRRGRLFHYTGTPNKLTSGRDVPNEVAKRLQRAGFSTELNGDGVLAVRR
jgi:hypothetical protein